MISPSAELKPLSLAQNSDRIAHKCEHCETTIFEVKNGMLIFERKHHGETHTTIVSITELYRQYASALTLPLPMMDFYGGVGQ